MRLFVAYRAAQTPQNANVPATITCRENIEIYYIFSFLFYLHYYNIYASQATRDYCRLSHDYSPTIRRLFRDCPATILGTRREPRENLRVVLEKARRLSGWQIWQQERRAALARRAAGSAEDLRAWARTWAAVSRRRGGMPLFAPESPFKRALML